MKQSEDIGHKALVFATGRYQKSPLLSLWQDRRLVEKGLDSSPTAAVQLNRPDKRNTVMSACLAKFVCKPSLGRSPVAQNRSFGNVE